MFIRINLPARYQRLQSIKRDNYPYSTLFHAYMQAVVRLAKREQLDLFAVFGRIEHTLANDVPLMLSDDGQDSVRLDYKENDPEIIAFYKSSPLTQKKTTLMFVRTLLRLTGKYGNSIPELIYLIDTLPAADAIHEPAATTAIYKPVTPAVHSNVSSQELKPIDPKTMVRIKKRTNKTTVTDAIKHAHKTTSDSTPAVKTTSDSTPVKTEKQTEDILKRVEQLKQTIDDDGTGKSAKGQKVKTNALLGQFMD